MSGTANPTSSNAAMPKSTSDQYSVKSAAMKFLMPRDIKDKWKKIYGEDSWDGLLTPDIEVHNDLHHDFRHTILHYGNMAKATYDGFKSRTKKCRYKKEEFLDKVGLVKDYPYEYEIRHYLYIEYPNLYSKISSVVCCKPKRTWIGYIAVAKDHAKEKLGKRDIVIAWRGSSMTKDWCVDILGTCPELSKKTSTTKSRDINSNSCACGLKEWLLEKLRLSCVCTPRVHGGWLSMYRSTTTDDHEELWETLRNLLEKYKKEEISITITGHTMGAALATLNARDITEKLIGDQKDNIPVTAFVFASPYVGDIAFKNEFENLQKKGRHLRLLRINNEGDVVARCCYFCISDPTPCVFNAHVGKEMMINTILPVNLKRRFKVEARHRMDVYLRGVNSTVLFDRSIALPRANKNYYCGNILSCCCGRL